MKTALTILFIAIQSIVYSQVIAGLGFENTLGFELSKVEINLHDFDSISIESEYLDSLKFKPKILAFNISGVDANGDELFTKSSKGNKIPSSFKTKYLACYDCKFIRVKSITLSWFYGEKYVPRKSKQWKVDH